MVEDALERVRAQVGGRAGAWPPSAAGSIRSVAAALVQRAVGDQLTCVFVDTGLLRAGEPETVAQAFRDTLGARLVAVNAAEEFLEALSGVTDPEQKRKIIGEKFIRIFEREALRAAGGGAPPASWSRAPSIPTWSNPPAPSARWRPRSRPTTTSAACRPTWASSWSSRCASCSKTRCARSAWSWACRSAMVWRQPFPGPGLAVRCLGEITWERLETLRGADKIVTDELGAAGLLRNGTAQAFAVLLPVRSVGVMGDYRTYQEVCAIRAVTTDDFMTADWARLPYDLLARISNRIVNEVKGINRVVYDISSKPPATIEWE